MAANTHIMRVAIVGASGNLGNHFTRELLKTGKHTITALTRESSTSVMPAGVKIARVNYEDESSIVKALENQQFLVITLTTTVKSDLHARIVNAAAKAGVHYVMPNIYGYDTSNEALISDELYHGNAAKIRQSIEDIGLPYVIMACGFWYEWSLTLGEPWFGFDIKERKVTLIDDGTTKINVSSWEQCGRALARFLSLPEENPSPAVADWKNKHLFIASMRVSQREMLNSLHRVLGTTDKDWTITHEPSKERVQTGREEMKQGLRTGFVKGMYTRLFFPSADGDFERTHGLDNDKLGLPKEDIDHLTRHAVEMLGDDWKPVNQYESTRKPN